MTRTALILVAIGLTLSGLCSRASAADREWTKHFDKIDNSLKSKLDPLSSVPPARRPNRKRIMPKRAGKSSGWGCDHCGYKNGPDLQALKYKFANRPVMVALPDGTVVLLR